MSEATFRGDFDAASSELWFQSLQHDNLGALTVHYLSPIHEVYRELILADAVVTGFEMDSGGERPKIAWTVSFSTLTWNDPDGDDDFCWDVATQAECVP